jgi:hypothetical protein
VTPRLIHPIKVELVQIDPDRTPAVHPQFREPQGKPVYKDPIILTAQLGSPRTMGAYRQRPQGDDPQSDGHLLFRVVDLQREAPDGFAFHRGDRVTKLYAGDPQEDDFTPVNWVATETDPTGHYRGRHTLWAVFYRDMKTLSQVV